MTIFEECGFIYISDGQIIYIILPTRVTNENGYTEYNNITEGVLGKESLKIICFIDIKEENTYSYEANVLEVLGKKSVNNETIIYDKFGTKKFISYNKKHIGMAMKNIEVEKGMRYNEDLCLSMKRNG